MSVVKFTPTYFLKKLKNLELMAESVIKTAWDEILEVILESTCFREEVRCEQR